VTLSPRAENVPPAAYWNDVFTRYPEAQAADLLGIVATLRKEKKFADVQAAVSAFLRLRTKDPEPWLYELLALAIELNKGKPEDVKAALGYAADQALKGRRPHDMTRVADSLAIRQLYDRCGPLLDRAADLDPGFATPLLMSLGLATRTDDPKRMAWAADRLLALGWPGTDAAWRALVRKQADDLAKRLREAGRDAEARTLLDRVAAAEPRDLVLRLTWKGDADLDLAVEEPLGAVANMATPRTVFGGAIVVNGYGKHPEEVYTCPRAFDGPYTVTVNTIYNNEKDPAQDITLEIIAHEGTDRERIDRRPIRLDSPSPVTFRLEGGRRTSVLPYQALPVPPVVAAPPAGATPAPTATRPAPTPSPANAADALRLPTPARRP
jgi:hypothetical protein